MSASAVPVREPFRCRAAGHTLTGVRIRVAEPAAATTLVFLHEGLGAVTMWRDFPDALCAATGLDGLVYDRWGYGLSDPFDRPRTVRYLHDEAFEALPDVLDAAGIADPLPVGHSDGGSIALLYAARYAGRCRAVIAEAPHVFVEEVTLAGIRDAVVAWEKGELRAGLTRHHREKTERVFHAWADNWLSPGFRAWDITAELAELRCPVLLVQGEDDAYGTEAQLTAIAQAVRGPVETAMLPDCGHVPHQQARDATLARMTRFIAGHLPG